MRFKIVSVGWNCERFITQTLQSVQDQTDHGWDIAIIYDFSGDHGADVIRPWCDQDPVHRLYRFNTEQLYAVRNQYEAIHQMLQPNDDDVIVYLDLDGDQFAHREVLQRLREAYEDPNVLLTYGQYESVPYSPRCIPASLWPPNVVRDNTYRQHILENGPCFNHLRTLKYEIFKAIPEDQFKWPNGTWYKGGTDYVTMVPALELVAGRYKFMEEVLLKYNHANPLADNKVQYDERLQGKDASADVCTRPPLGRYMPPPKVQAVVSVEPVIRYLDSEERREILRTYARQYGMRTFVESGTNDGSTPLTLVDEFDDLYTIELSRDLWMAAKNRLESYPKIHCLQGDSTVVLGEVLKAFEGPALFWLDGHYSGGVTARGDLDTPVVQELEAIFADGRSHVILVDDARIFEGGPEHFDEPHYNDYPSITWVANLAVQYNYDFLLEGDIMRLTPR